MIARDRAFVVFMVVMLSASLAACAADSPEPSAQENPIERGRYLVAVGGCHDCHSPKMLTAQGPMPDTTRLLSGHPQDMVLPEIDSNQVGPGKWILFNEHLTCAVGPWGVSFAANLTPDKETGAGAWPEEMFIQAIRAGKHLGSGRPILPPMPWQNLAELTDEDLKAIHAYLRSIPPIRNQVPDPIPPDKMAGP